MSGFIFFYLPGIFTIARQDFDTAIPDAPKIHERIFTMATHYLACDIGADSGRLILGTLDNGKIAMRNFTVSPTVP